jgi:hypothetical protein
MAQYKKSDKNDAPSRPHNAQQRKLDKYNQVPAKPISGGEICEYT